MLDTSPYGAIIILRLLDARDRLIGSTRRPDRGSRAPCGRRVRSAPLHPTGLHISSFLPVSSHHHINHPTWTSTAPPTRSAASIYLRKSRLSTTRTAPDRISASQRSLIISNGRPGGSNLELKRDIADTASQGHTVRLQHVGANLRVYPDQ